jgi:hypothetical protein
MAPDDLALTVIRVSSKRGRNPYNGGNHQRREQPACAAESDCEHFDV